jgi:hypothetical protein
MAKNDASRRESEEISKPKNRHQNGVTKRKNIWRVAAKTMWRNVQPGVKKPA